MATNGVTGQSGTRPGDKEKIPMTREGLEEKRARLHFLVTERRQQVADYIHEAKEAGDVSESSAYEDAKNLQAMVEGEIQELQRVVDNAYIIEVPDETEGHRTVRLGSKVQIETPRGLKEMTLVSTHEANTITGKISNDSPVGRALLGHSEGDKVEVVTPGGTQIYTVKAIK
ncbi:MAG TPA: transcription elongation factor GreA [Ktedonobacterales bacterium]|nr:transcription elongation factor GreA [Ktedonobacterales bacterium]